MALGPLPVPYRSVTIWDARDMRNREAAYTLKVEWWEEPTAGWAMARILNTKGLLVDIISVVDGHLWPMEPNEKFDFHEPQVYTFRVVEEL